MCQIRMALLQMAFKEQEFLRVENVRKCISYFIIIIKIGLCVGNRTATKKSFTSGQCRCFVIKGKCIRISCVHSHVENGTRASDPFKIYIDSCFYAKILVRRNNLSGFLVPMSS